MGILGSSLEGPYTCLVLQMMKLSSVIDEMAQVTQLGRSGTWSHAFLSQPLTSNHCLSKLDSWPTQTRLGVRRLILEHRSLDGEILPYEQIMPSCCALLAVN